MVVAFNQQVACQPFQRTGAEAVVQKGFATLKQRDELVPLLVIFGVPDKSVDVGDVIWVKGESVKAQWAMREYSIDDQVVILVPMLAIQLVSIEWPGLDHRGLDAAP